MSWGLSSNKLTALKNDKSKVRSAKSYCGQAESNSVDTDTRKSSAKNVLTDAVYTSNSDSLKQRVDNWNKGVTDALEYTKGVMAELIFWYRRTNWRGKREIKKRKGSWKKS